MLDVLPAGTVPLEAEELDQVVGGVSIWRIIAGAAVVGFTVGRWIACAVECLVFDA